ncbi:MAG: STY4851/ECs_5259 family protein, partial [bacterium]
MISRYQEWLNSFLEQRSLKIPDGRPLYAYLCSTEEFNEVEALLSSANMTVNINSFESLHYSAPGLERLFVLYCAEWWRRNYKSGPWKWQPILNAVSCPFLDHRTRTQFVEFGLRYWKRDLLRRGDYRGFLLTVACEGGLPINLVRNDTGYLRAFLRAVLRDFATYHTTGVDAAELASSHLDYLPAGLRQQMVQELAGMLIETIWELQNQLSSQLSDPVEELDRLDPDWRHKLPMVLEDEAANALILALLQQARKIRTGKVTELHLVRRLLRNGPDWQLQAELKLPDVIDRNWLMKELGVEQALGERLELRMSWSEKTMRVASLVQQGDEYNVYPHDRRKLHIRESADREINCFVYERGRQVGHLSLPNGSGLTEELPLVFVDREGGAQTLEFWAQGSLSSRFPEVFVLSQFMPEPLSSTSDCDEIELIAESLQVLEEERCLYRLSGEFSITLDQDMTCVIRTQQTEESRAEYRFDGRRNYLVETKWPVFMGTPLVRRVQDKGRVNKVPIEELYWSKTTGKRKWQQVSQSPAGLVELRHRQNGECLFARRVIILPAEAQVSLVPTDDRNKGRIELRQIGTNLVSWEDHCGVDIEKTINDDVVVLHCTAEKATHGKIRLKLRWDNGCECDFEIPFPAEGGRFVAPDGRVLTASEYVALDNLFGYSAAALSLHGGRSFKILGELKGSDIDGPMHRFWHFEAPLSEVTGNLNVYELPLYELQQKLKQLFSLSSDRDAVVTLQLLCSGSLEARLDVRQFVGELQFDYDSREVRIEHCDGHGELHLNESIELLPLADPEAESHHLQARDEELVWPIEQEILERGPWLAVAPEKGRSRYRPRLVAAPSQSNPTLTLQSGLGQIVAEPHEETRIQIM